MTSHSRFIELNIDGLVGPTHHYAGLAFGNIASLTHAHHLSNPREAALQGLEKMSLLMKKGLKQAFLPPPLRPNLALLHQLGFTGEPRQQIQAAFKKAPHLLSAAYSSAQMWTANAATVSAAPDTQDQKLHITPANLISQLHRAQDSGITAKHLQKIFANYPAAIHHPALPGALCFSDEGAANHLRLTSQHGQEGITILVYGKSIHTASPSPQKYPARQTKEACEAIARQHGLKKVLMVQQNPAAIDAGVFHNDVISLANESLFILHELAFLKQNELIHTLQQTLPFPLKIITILNQTLTLQEAVETYLFNSQLVTLPNHRMLLIAPEECQQHPKTHLLITQWLDDPSNPIKEVAFLNLKQSMQNGGGPACLRLRVPLPETAVTSLNPSYVLTHDLLAKLQSWVKTYYRDRLTFQDFLDDSLMVETQCAADALDDILEAG